MELAKTAESVTWISGGRLPGRGTEEKGRGEGKEDEGSEEKKVRNEIIEEVIDGSQKMVVEESWQEGDQLAEQLKEKQHVEGIIERRRMEGSSLKIACHTKST